MLYRDTHELDKYGKKGDWAFMSSTDDDGKHYDNAYICLMWGDDSFSQMAILPIVEMKGRPKPWTWDGNKLLPTLIPSILVSSTKPHTNEKIELFHGYLVKGVLIHC